MRIVHVIENMDPAWGGPVTAASGMTAALAMRGHEVVLVSHRVPARQAAIDQYLLDAPHLKHVVPRFLPPPGTRAKLLATESRTELADIIQGAQMVHLHGVWEPLLISAATVAERLGVPYGISPHGMLTTWSLGRRAWKKQMALCLRYRAFLERGTFLHLVSEAERASTADLKLATREHVVPLGVFADAFDQAPPAGTFHAQHAELQGQPYVLFLGRVHPCKGLGVLLEAFALIAVRQPELRLVVAGPDAGYGEILRRRVSELGLSSRVLVTGPLYGQAKWAAFRDATCFCLPSDHESYSVAITEALLFSLPVVLSPHCNRPEVATEGAGLIVPQQPEALAAALAQACQSDQRQKMGTAARRLAIERFSWSKVAEQIEAMYREDRKAAPAAGEYAPTRWRSLARHGALTALSIAQGSGVHDLRRPRVQFLLYHDLKPKAHAAFRAQIRGLSEMGKFISYDEAVTRVASGAIDQPYFAVSFDDGLAGSFDAAAVLESLGIRACFFVCPSIIGVNDPQMIARFCRENMRVKPASFMSWDQLEQLQQRGHEIGSHTWSHARLVGASQQVLTEELGRSREALIRRLGAVRHFAWCFGRFSDFSASASDAVFAAGYTSCASGVRGSHAPGAPAERPICLRRDQLEPSWPQRHVKYFMIRSAKRPLASLDTWPADWQSVLSKSGAPRFTRENVV